MKYSVLHVLTDLSLDGGYGGIAVNVTEQLNSIYEIRESNIKLGVFSTYVGDANIELNSLPVAIERVLHKAVRPGRRYIYVFQIPKNCFKGIRQLLNKYSIIHVHFSRELVPVIICIIRILSRKKFVIQTHGTIAEAENWNQRLWDIIFTKRILPFASAIIYISENERLYLLSIGVPVNKFQYVPNGIKVAATKCSNLSKLQPKLIFAARIHPRKNPALFLNIARNFVSEYPEAIIEMYGKDAGALNQLQSAFKEHESHWYKGSLGRDGILEVMKTSNLLILPSTNEPFPISVLEAFGSGVPVLIYKSCGISAQVSEIDELMVANENETNLNRQAGLLIEKYSDAAARGQLVRRAESIFSALISGDQLAKCYDSVSNI